jgi:hypothetical protein
MFVSPLSYKSYLQLLFQRLVVFRNGLEGVEGAYADLNILRLVLVLFWSSRSHPKFLVPMYATDHPRLMLVAIEFSNSRRPMLGV